MKKLKAVAIISGVLTALQLIPFIPVVWSSLMTAVEFKMASAVGIIGYADGPTSVIVASAFHPMLFILWARYGFFALCGLTCIISTILYVKRKKL